MNIKELQKLHEFLDKPSHGRRSGKTFKAMLKAVHDTDFSKHVIFASEIDTHWYMIDMAIDIAKMLEHKTIKVVDRKTLKLDNGEIRFVSFDRVEQSNRGLRAPVHKDHYRKQRY